MPLSSTQKCDVVVVDGNTVPVVPGVPVGVGVPVGDGVAVGTGVPVTDVIEVIKVDGVALLVASVVGG